MLTFKENIAQIKEAKSFFGEIKRKMFDGLRNILRGILSYNFMFPWGL